MFVFGPLWFVAIVLAIWWLNSRRDHGEDPSDIERAKLLKRIAELEKPTPVPTQRTALIDGKPAVKSRERIVCGSCGRPNFGYSRLRCVECDAVLK